MKKLEKELAESKSCIAEHETTLEALKKQNQKESESLKQKIQKLGNENTTLKGELEKIKNQHSNDLTEHETKLEEFNKENESLEQKKSLENENTPLKGELGKTKTNEVSLEKVGKRQFSPKVAYASLAAMLVVGAALSCIK